MKNSIFSIRITCMACAITLTSLFNPVSAEMQLNMFFAENNKKNCEPTPSDYLGPFYKADAPVRARVGKGYTLNGVVLSTEDCAPIQKARLELWLVNSDGSYDDDHRATIFSDGNGEYSFESNFPSGYYGRPPHIHIRISAEGFKTLATQHYPTYGRTSGEFDIVLVPIE